MFHPIPRQLNQSDQRQNKAYRDWDLYAGHTEIWIEATSQYRERNRAESSPTATCYRSRY